MADPNRCSSSSPPPAGFALDSDEISSLLHTLLQSSSLPPSFASLQSTQHHHQQQAAEQIRQQFCGSAAFDESVGGIESSAGLNFPFPGDCYAPGETDRSGSAFSGAIASSAEGIGDFDCDSERDQVEALRDPAAAGSSSKRSRVAEFHNLSEKRRRQRINEKMKALQKLIPNSNKTDKASMLDDAIDYLKQLQLQVQPWSGHHGYFDVHCCIIIPKRTILQRRGHRVLSLIQNSANQKIEVSYEGLCRCSTMTVDTRSCSVLKSKMDK